MLGELISMYVNGFTAFWRGMFGGGMVQLVALAFVLWWLFCRRGNRCCCPHCGCWCGRCQCDEVRMEHAEAEPVKKARKKKAEPQE
jgi:hypothetical protein